ncbi:MAG: exopolysaccharide biosynthesis protein [Alphaproteobacteria bacterium]|nr:exopolysaccharide biosynthesis protein [Alphaproteobacteria bacterium]MBL6938486.1 exopolysaccharide biosynthesis protein [Alphaproteobacteria bacterium]MBL7096545.1 exopolysaccharide biosynthesis protein [Alphaproteobacteria bacterium]
MHREQHAVPALERVKQSLSDDSVSLGWLCNALEGQATYLLLLVFALIGLLPGACVIAGIAMCMLSAGLIASPGAARLPQILASRRITSGQTRYVLEHAIHALRFVEPFASRPRLTIPAFLRLPIGALMAVLGALMLMPIPLSNLPPALAAVALSLALIEDSVVLLLVAGSGSLAAIALSAQMGFAVAHTIASL